MISAVNVYVIDIVRILWDVYGGGQYSTEGLVLL